MFNRAVSTPFPLLSPAHHRTLQATPSAHTNKPPQLTAAIQPPLDATQAAARTTANSHLRYHLLPSLIKLAETTTPLTPTETATIIYLHLPLLLEQLRKYAHDARGAQYEEYCVAYAPTSPVELAAAWAMVEAVWEHAAARTCAFALEWVDALRGVMRVEEEKARRARWRGRGRGRVDRGTQTD